MTFPSPASATVDADPETEQPRRDISSLVNRALSNVEPAAEPSASAPATRTPTTQPAPAPQARSAREPAQPLAATAKVPLIIEPIDLSQLDTPASSTRSVSVMKPAAPRISPTPPSSIVDVSIPPTPSPTDIPDTYTIQPGDTLGHIAQRFYGRSVYYPAIVDQNPGIDPLRSQVGQEIRLPRRGTRGIPAASPTPTAARRETPVPDTRTITVQEGDSLYAIARREYGDGEQWPRIHRANADVLDDPSRLRVGMTLVIPPSPTGRSSRPD